MTTTQRPETASQPMTWRRCIASPGASTIIDIVHPETGLTLSYGKSLEDCRKEYPDAQLMTVAAFCEQKAARQDQPVQWREETEEHHWEMLEVLPPACMIGAGALESITSFGISTRIGDSGYNLLVVHPDTKEVKELESADELGAAIKQRWTYEEFVGQTFNDA